MVLDHLLLSPFRNHQHTAITGTAKFNLLTGENGAGKTNVLEAISLLAPGRGLRRAMLVEMAAKTGGRGAGGFVFSADVMAGGDAVRLGTASLPDAPNRRVVQINGADASAAALGEWLSISWLTPAMDRLFVDSPSARRGFLDRLVLALEPGHARAVSRLDTALRERNRLLGEAAEPDPAWCTALESQIAEAGELVSLARARLVARLSQALDDLPEAPFARPNLAYVAGGPSEAGALTVALAENRSRDRAAGRSLIGPHRDDLMAVMAGKMQPAALCSTGEQKAMLIAIILAQTTLLDRTRPAVLLLDEVAAHLDPLRRAALFARLGDGPAQVWMTGTEIEPFAEIANQAVHWRVESGRVTQV